MKRAQTTGPKMVIFTSLLGQEWGLLGQWPISYNFKDALGHVKFLGVEIDSKLTFNKHIETLCSKVNKSIKRSVHLLG